MPALSRGRRLAWRGRRLKSFTRGAERLRSRLVSYGVNTGRLLRAHDLRP
jgi:hypothetical protein